MALNYKVNLIHQFDMDQLTQNQTTQQLDDAQQHSHHYSDLNDEKHFSNIHQGKYVSSPQSAVPSGGKSSLIENYEQPNITYQQPTDINLEASNDASNEIGNIASPLATDAPIETIGTNSLALDAGNVSASLTPMQVTNTDDVFFGVSPAPLNEPIADIVTPDIESIAINQMDVTTTSALPIDTDSLGTEGGTGEEPPLGFLGAPDLSVPTTSGSEGTDIPLNITVESTSVDIDNESITVTINNVPDGGSFSAGTDNGDGSWTFTSDDLDNLTFSPPIGISSYNLDVTAVASDGTDTATTTDRFDININAGGETITLTDDRDNYTSTELSDTVYAGEGRDQIDGGTGDDTLYGEGGNDRLYGEEGNDTLHGGSGDDRLYGGEGSDTLRGGTGDDRLYGEEGNDLFIFGENEGSDRVYGGSGLDDIIKLEGVDEGPNMGGENGWTLSVKGNVDYHVDTDNQTVTFTDGDASGSITLDDGSQIDFQDIDKIVW